MHYVFLTFIALVIQETLQRKQNTDKNKERTMVNVREPNSSTARNCNGQGCIKRPNGAEYQKAEKGSW